MRSFISAAARPTSRGTGTHGLEARATLEKSPGAGREGSRRKRRLRKRPRRGAVRSRARAMVAGIPQIRPRSVGAAAGADAVELFEEFLRAAVLLPGGARRVIEMTLAADVGVLKAVRPATELAGDGFALGDQV